MKLRKFVSINELPWFCNQFKVDLDTYWYMRQAVKRFLVNIIDTQKRNKKVRGDVVFQDIYGEARLRQDVSLTQREITAVHIIDCLLKGQSFDQHLKVNTSLEKLEYTVTKMALHFYNLSTELQVKEPTKFTRVPIGSYRNGAAFFFNVNFPVP